MLKKSMLKNGLLLALFAMLCTALVAGVNQFTYDKIKQKEAQELLRVLHQIVPDNIHDNNLIEHCILIHNQEALGTDEPLPAYIASMAGTPVAIALEAVAPDGYNGDIKIIIAIDTENQVLGVRTLSHNETPGLGDKIDLRKSDWVTSFNGLSLQADNGKPWAVKKDGGDFDQFTGATITPRAYVNAVHKAISFFKSEQQNLLSRPANCEVDYD